MKTKQLTSILLSITILIVVICYPVSAIETIDYTYKLDKYLDDILKNTDDDELIKVSVWLTDIDYDEVYRRTENELLNKVRNQEISENTIDLLGYTMSDVSVSAKVSTNSILAKNINNVNNENKLSIYNKVSEEDAQILLETKRKISKELYTEKNTQILNEISYKIFDNVSNTKQKNHTLYISSYAPNLDLELTKSQILELLQDENVDKVYYSSYNSEYITENLVSEVVTQNEVTVNNTDEEVNNYTYWQDMTGITQLKNSGVTYNRKIGLLEASIPYVEQNSVDYGEYYDVFAHMFDEENPANNRMIYRESDVQILNVISSNRWHAINSASILVGDSEYCEGIVPQSTLYCASESGDGNLKGGFEWLVEQGVRVICQNNGYLLWHTLDNYYTDLSKWIDHIAYMHGVNVVLPSGNCRKANTNGGYYAGAENTVLMNSMSFNAIVVGNYSYVTEDVVSSYNSLTDLPIKPDVVAPGANVGTPIGDITSGTSLSAPITAGIVALLATDPFCYTNPCFTKALLTASADYLGDYNNSDGTVATGFDSKSGAGIINVYKAYQILQSYTENQNPTYDYDFGVILSQSSLTNSTNFVVTDINSDICFSYVWMKRNTVDTPHFNSATVDAEYPSIKVTITAPNGNVFKSYYANDCKANVVFSPTCTGTYTISYELMNDFVLTGSLKYATTLCRMK